MMPILDRNWAGACGGRWVGPRPLEGGTGGCWIVQALGDGCDVDLWAPI